MNNLAVQSPTRPDAVAIFAEHCEILFEQWKLFVKTRRAIKLWERKDGIRGGVGPCRARHAEMPIPLCPVPTEVGPALIG